MGWTTPVLMIDLILCIMKVTDFTSFSEVSERQYRFSKYQFKGFFCFCFPIKCTFCKKCKQYFPRRKNGRYTKTAFSVTSVIMWDPQGKQNENIHNMTYTVLKLLNQCLFCTVLRWKITLKLCSTWKTQLSLSKIQKPYTQRNLIWLQTCH